MLGCEIFHRNILNSSTPVCSILMTAPLVVFCHFFKQSCTEAVHHLQDAAIYTYGNFQETRMVLFTICVIIILTPKQFSGLSVSYLQNSTQILNMIEISAA